MKHKHRRRKRKKAVGPQLPVGASPGTIVIPEGSPPPRIRLIRYAADFLEEEEVADPSKLYALLARGGNSWIDVQGLGDRDVLETVARCFELHPLLLENVTMVPQRPKAESYDGCAITIVHRVVWKDDDVDARQISVLFGKDYVITFQEAQDDALEPVRARLRSGLGMMRRSGPDYLTYAILDTVIDGYFPLVDTIGQRLDAI